MENVSLCTIVLFTYTRGKRGIMVSSTCFLPYKRIIFSKRNKKTDRSVFKQFIHVHFDKCINFEFFARKQRKTPKNTQFD